MALSDMLERGYFPEELPNPFVTTSFASAVTGSGATLPADFKKGFSGGYPSVRSARPGKYSHARRGLLRRRLCLPNPLLHYLLCREIDANWGVLQPHIGGTVLSATNPVQAARGRSIQPAQPLAAGPGLAVRTRLNSKYVLRTDITRFYYSIYTHAIPWALHTKPVAKGNTGHALLGNQIDYLVRNGQDKQTVGIPVGPDTSLVIAEILMQACDKELLDACRGLHGHRFIDDYELGFRSRAEAEDAFDTLERILAGYELALNPSKTQVTELPCNLEAPWVSPLRSFPFEGTASSQQGELWGFFDLAFELHGQYPDDGVLQFALGRLRRLEVAPSNWKLFQRLLLNCAAPEPATLRWVLASITSGASADAPPVLSDIEEVMNSLIIDHSAVAHSSEVAWALWGCLALGMTVSAKAAAAVSKCDDSVVALLALHCEDQGLVSTPLDRTVWSSYMNQDSLYGEHWLLAYEANVKGWLPSQGGSDHVSADSNFGFLKTAGVSFYDKSKAVRASPGAPIPVPNLPTPPAGFVASPS